MKKVSWILLCTFIFIVVFGISGITKFMSAVGIGGTSSYSLQGDTKNPTLSGDEIEKEIIDVKYITKDGEIETRQIILYKPAEAEGDIPLIYIPHYAVVENSTDFQSYIKNGWAAASPYNFQDKYNGELVTDDLVFNNAALYTLRNLDGIDKQRIGIVGGSAGGYTTLMLNELQMGTTASIANSPITNVYFNFHIHFLNSDELNRNSGLFDFPIPIQGMVSKSFRPINDNFESDEDSFWEAVSPISMAKTFSNPTVINHFTGDILVPIDQISKNYTYDSNDGTLPDEFNARMDDIYPGILSSSLEEQANPNEIFIKKYEYPNNIVDVEMPYSDKLLTINIIDDGPISAKGSHTSPNTIGTYDSIPYLKDMFTKTLKETERLVPEKLILLLDRYQGNSKQLPAHKNIDDTIYGSLAVYQKEIIDELSTYINNHSLEELDKAINDAIDNLSKDASAKTSYTTTWNEIISKIN